MIRPLAFTLALLAPITGCRFAIEHPAATTAIVGGVIGGGTCELATDDEHLACGGVTLGAAVFLGGVVLLATLFGGDGRTILQGDDAPDVPQDPTLDQPAPAPAPATP